MQPKRLADCAFITPGQEADTREAALRGGFTPNIISSPGSLLAGGQGLPGTGRLPPDHVRVRFG